MGTTYNPPYIYCLFKRIHLDMQLKPRAVEFFSGLGAFSVAAREAGIEVVAAFDQSSEANDCYRLNFGRKPVDRNLDSLPFADIPDAEIWWMSPPCKPYTVRGNRRDVEDPRAASFLHLIEGMRVRRPETVVVENVGGFAASEARTRFVGAAGELGMRVDEVDLCPTQFGVPMKRPRRFVVARRELGGLEAREPAGMPALPRRNDGALDFNTGVPDAELEPIGRYLDLEPGTELLVDEETLKRFGESLNVLDADDPEAVAICFTSGYWKSMRSAGSFIRSNGSIRRFSPEEILRLMGFPADYKFPKDMLLQSKLRLAGNTVNVLCLTHVLAGVGYTSKLCESRF